jgi:rSAM/selenodomain-associated transferase 1
MAVDVTSTLIVQFAREPVAGKVKTRMMPALTAVQACDLHCDLVRWTCGRLVGSGLGPVHLAVAGDCTHPLFSECREIGAKDVVTQRGANLGERMYQAIEQGLGTWSAVLLVGSDCPAIDGAYLHRAREALRHCPVVLGPAEDGGYVLVGATAVSPRLFEDIPWGSDKVLALTRSRLRELGREWAELDTLADIDRPEDLARWSEWRRVAP